MPLLLSPVGKEVVIEQCHARGNLKRHMEDLGLFPGEKIVLVSENDGNLILKIHETRLAINQDLASKIYVKQVF